MNEFIRQCSRGNEQYWATADRLMRQLSYFQPYLLLIRHASQLLTSCASQPCCSEMRLLIHIRIGWILQLSNSHYLIRYIEIRLLMPPMPLDSHFHAIITPLFAIAVFRAACRHGSHSASFHAIAAYNTGFLRLFRRHYFDDSIPPVFATFSLSDVSRFHFARRFFAIAISLLHDFQPVMAWLSFSRYFRLSHAILRRRR